MKIKGLGVVGQPDFLADCRLFAETRVVRALVSCLNTNRILARLRDFGFRRDLSEGLGFAGAVS